MNYEAIHLIFTQPQPAANSDYVEIKSNGWFKVEFSALFDNLSDRRLIR